MSFWDSVKHEAEVVEHAAEDSLKSTTEAATDIAHHGAVAGGLGVAAAAESALGEELFAAGWVAEHFSLPDEGQSLRDASNAVNAAAQSDAEQAGTELREGAIEAYEDY